MHNLKPYQKKQECRKDIFYQYEYPGMANLPNELFEIKKITKAKVQSNYHVFLGQEKNYYSVPYHYVGKQALIFYIKLPPLAKPLIGLFNKFYCPTPTCKKIYTR
jgi:hypothetical protein